MSDTDYQYGFLADYRLSWPLDFSVTRGDGIIHEGGLCFVAHPDPENSYQICGTASYTESQGKIFASTDVDGTYTNFSEITGRVGMGHSERLASFYTDAGNRWGALFSSSFSSIGVAHVTNQIPDRTIGGEEFSSDATSTNILSMSDVTSFLGLELTFGQRFPNIQISAPIEIDVTYDGDDDEWNSMGVNVGLMLSFGYGDNMGRPSEEFREPDGWQISYLMISDAMRLVSDVFKQRALNRASEIVQGMIPDEGSDGPLSTEDLVYLGGVTSLLGSYSLARARRLALSVGAWGLVPVLGQAVGGVVLAAAGGSDSGRGSGYADILTASTSIIQMFWGVDEYSERQELGPEATNKALMDSALVGAALDFLSVAIGVAITNKDQSSDVGNTLMLGGAGALNGLAFPAAGDPSDVDTQTNTISPALTFIYDGNWSTAIGIDTHNSWIGLPFYTRFFALTDAVSNGDNPSIIIGSEFGGEYKSDYFHIGGGAGATTRIGGLASGAGVFVGGGLGGLLPLGDTGVALDIAGDISAGYMGGGFTMMDLRLGLRF